MGKILTRMGDGSRIEMTEAEIQQDLESGAQDAAAGCLIEGLKSPC